MSTLVAALTTPAPVYWLLDLVQLVGYFGIVGGLWFLGTKAAGPVEACRIRRQMRKAPRASVRIVVDTSQLVAAMNKAHRDLQRLGSPTRKQRGASRAETIIAWTLIVGGCAAAWALVIYGVASKAVG